MKPDKRKVIMRYNAFINNYTQNKDKTIPRSVFHINVNISENIRLIVNKNELLF